MECFNPLIKRLSVRNYFFRKGAVFSIFVFIKFKYQLCLWFFYQKIGINLLNHTDCLKTDYIPTPISSVAKFGGLMKIYFPALKEFYEHINHRLMSTSHTQSFIIRRVFTSFIDRVFFNTNIALSINNTSQVNKFFFVSHTTIICGINK